MSARDHLARLQSELLALQATELALKRLAETAEVCCSSCFGWGTSIPAAHQVSWTEGQLREIGDRIAVLDADIATCTGAALLEAGDRDGYQKWAADRAHVEIDNGRMICVEA